MNTDAKKTEAKFTLISYRPNGSRYEGCGDYVRFDSEMDLATDLSADALKAELIKKISHGDSCCGSCPASENEIEFAILKDGKPVFARGNNLYSFQPEDPWNGELVSDEDAAAAEKLSDAMSEAEKIYEDALLAIRQAKEEKTAAEQKAKDEAAAKKALADAEAARARQKAAEEAERKQYEALRVKYEPKPEPIPEPLVKAMEKAKAELVTA